MRDEKSKQVIKKPIIYEFIDDTKPKKKLNKVYNLDNLFDNHPFPEFVITNDPFERTMIKANNKERDINKRLFNIDSKYNNLMIQFGDGFLKKSNHIHMNKSDLKKLSKSELIKLLLKKEKKKPENYRSR